MSDLRAGIVWRCPKLLRRFAAKRQTDEKRFDIEQAHDSQNDRIWSVDPSLAELKFVERTQKPKQVMVWAGVNWHAKSPLIFVPQGTKVNGPEYRQMLETQVFPWAEENLGDEWCFQQDGAPSHRAYDTQQWIAENFPDAITVDPHWTRPTGEWPPNSRTSTLWTSLPGLTSNPRPVSSHTTPSLHLKLLWCESEMT